MKPVFQFFDKIASKSKPIVDNVDRLVGNVERIVDNTKPIQRKLDLLVAILLACIPFLQHYIGLVDNAGTTVLILLLPYLLLRLVATLRTFEFSVLQFPLILMVFFIYKLIDHGTRFSEIAQVGLMIFYLLCMCQGIINTNLLKKSVIFIASLAGIVLLVQYFCYYILGFHLQIVPHTLLLEESEAWIAGVKTGTVAVNGEVSKIYRPASFFLEPSHLFLYSFPALFISLFSSSNRMHNRICALLISIGMVLSTSGMGIAVAVGAWALFIALRSPTDDSYRLKNILRNQNLTLVCSMIILVALAIVYVPFVKGSVLRIFYNPGGSTAIDGRTEVALITLRKMTFLQKIFGVSDSTNDLNFNMPGFMATLYKYGIIGVVLSYWVYVKGLLKLNMPYFWYNVIILVVSFFSAHTHGTFFMLFYVLLLYHGHKESNEPWIRNLTGSFMFLYNSVKSLFVKKN